MDSLSGKQERHTTEIFIIIGYLVFFCLTLTLCYVFYIFTYLKQSAPPINAFATSLPPTTPTPHIYSDNNQTSKKIISDNFNNNQYRWEYQDDTSNAKIENGKLLLESLSKNNFAVAACQSCVIGIDPYFIQADFSTDVATDQSYGIVFNWFYSKNDFFLFEINTEAKKYYLYHHVSDNWSLRASGDSNLIESFPTVNTLGVFINKNDLEFYINGKIVDSYRESYHSFQIGYFGFYVDSSDFKLIVDNLSLTK